MTRHEEGQGRGCEGCRNLTRAVYADLWRKTWPLVVLFGLWIASGVVEAVINLAFA